MIFYPKVFHIKGIENATPPPSPEQAVVSKVLTENKVFYVSKGHCAHVPHAIKG